MICKTTSI